MRNIFTYTKPTVPAAITVLLGALMLPLPASASANTNNAGSHNGAVASPLIWAGTDCYNLISATGDWARFCITVNVDDWNEAKQALVTFTSYSGNFSFLRIDALDLNRNERIVEFVNYTQQYLDSTTGHFSTNWSDTYLSNYSAAVNMPCVMWQNGGWACAQPTWYSSATVFVL